MKRFIALIFAIAILVCSINSVFAAGKYGDVDNNDTVNIFDATEIQNHIAEITQLSDDALVLADVDDNGSITIMDVTTVQCYIAEIIPSFPVEDNQTEEPTEPTEAPTVVPTEEPTEPTEAPTVVPTEEPTENPTELSPNEYELEVLRLVNEERAKEGLEPYEFGYSGYACAKLRAQELLVRFEHTRPDGTPFFTVFDELGVNELFSSMGENIAMGHRSPEDVVDAWMNSPGHRANILDPDYEQLAVGVVEIPNSPGRYATVQLFWSTFKF